MFPQNAEDVKCVSTQELLRFLRGGFFEWRQVM